MNDLIFTIDGEELEFSKRKPVYASEKWIIEYNKKVGIEKFNAKDVPQEIIRSFSDYKGEPKPSNEFIIFILHALALTMENSGLLDDGKRVLHVEFGRELMGILIRAFAGEMMLYLAETAGVPGLEDHVKKTVGEDRPFARTLKKLAESMQDERKRKSGEEDEFERMINRLRDRHGF